MTKKLFNLTKVALLILSISFIFNSCTEEKTYVVHPEGEFAYVLLKDNITIEESQWTWDPSNNRYKASVSFTELHKSDYEFGMAIGNIYTFDNNDSENVTPLPYIKSYFQGNVPITETISCALSHDKKNVEFYIEASDKVRYPEAPAKYYFKVALIFNFTY